MTVLSQSHLPVTAGPGQLAVVQRARLVRGAMQSSVLCSSLPLLGVDAQANPQERTGRRDDHRGLKGGAEQTGRCGPRS